MKPLEVNLFDNSLIFEDCVKKFGFYATVPNQRPSKIKYVHKLMEYNGITVFTDWYISRYNISIVDKVKSPIKVAWLFEPKAVNPHIYKEIKRFGNKFDYVLTFDENLLKENNEYIKVVTGGSQVEKEKWGIYKKNKLVSLICSKKKKTIGHKLRHFIEPNLRIKHNIDFWGFEYKAFEDHSDPLKDYYFSITIENSVYKNYFTEKIVDCFALGVIPIYWGAPNIDDFFNPEGIISFNSIKYLDKLLIQFFDYYSFLLFKPLFSNFFNFYQKFFIFKKTIKKLDKILSNVISPYYYDNHIKAVRDNYERAKKYRSRDDMVAEILMKL